MKKIFLLFSVTTLFWGCTSYYPPKKMYSDYGFTYDYSQSPVPAAEEVPAVSTTTTPAPTFLVQVPPPTVIYQNTPVPLQSSTDTNTAISESSGAELPNPYKGTYLIPPKVVVVPQQTIIHETAGAVPGTNITTTTQPATAYPYPYYPGAVGFLGVDTNAPPTNAIPNPTNPVPTNPIVNPTNVVPTPTNPPAPVRTNTFLPPINTPTTAGGSFAPPPAGATPLPGTGPGGTRTTAGGSFAPPPSGTPTLPGISHGTPTTAGGSFAPPPPGALLPNTTTPPK